MDLNEMILQVDIFRRNFSWGERLLRPFFWSWENPVLDHHHHHHDIWYVGETH